MADQVSFNIIINGVPQTIKSLADVDTTMGKLRNQYKRTESQAGRTALALKMGNLKGMQTQMMGVGTAMGRMGNQTNQAGVAMQNMNFVIRDSPYFFKDFQLGVLAVGNNMNPLIDSFQRLKMQAALMTEQTGKNVTAFSLLRKSMAGPMGLSVAMSILVTAIQAVVFSMGKANKEAEEMAKNVGTLVINVNELKEASESLRDSYRAALTGDLALEYASSLNKLTELEQRRRAAWLKMMTAPDIETGVAREDYNKLTEEINFIVSHWQKVFDAQKKGGKELKVQLTVLQEMQKKRKEDLETIKQLNDARKSGLLDAKQMAVVYKELAELYRKILEYAEKTAAIPTKGPAESIKELSSDVKRSSSSLKEFNLDLEVSRIVGRELGTVLQQAFMQGKFALDQMILSIISAIAQMLILKAITGAIGFAVGGPVGAAVAMTATASKSLGKNRPILVQGRISTEKNKFIADIENAKEYYYNNEGFVTIGR